MNRELLQQADAAGIETAFTDFDGNTQQADETTLRRLMQMLATPASGDAGLNTAMPAESTRAYQPDFARRGEKKWLLSVQLYSLTNARNWGHGDFTDLRHLLEQVADAGGGGVGINPLHALSEDNPDEASPYAPSSRIFLNWLYIDVGALPGITASDLEPLRPARVEDRLIDYKNVAAAKEQALRLAYRHLHRASAEEREAFAAFKLEMSTALRRYAAFCLLRKRYGSTWRSWRKPWAQPTPAHIDALAQDESDEIGFHEFVQWQAHRQLASCRAVIEQRQMPIGLYLDVAVGVHPDGFDNWDEPAAFLDGATLGAPPDALNRAGQNWGLTGFHPTTLRHSGYAAFRKMLAASMRHAGAIRLDHVLGLNRLYVIPPGADPTQGAYVRYPFADLLLVAAQESQRQRCLIIGEDLGTVPDGLRKALREHGIWTYRVVMFERDERGFLPPQNYPEAALATFSTHDLPTFAGWREGKDIDLLRTLGLESTETIEQRRSILAALGRTLESGDDVSFDAIVRFLNATPSRLIAFALEDLLGSTTQINMPGTYKEYPNWRHRLEFDRRTVEIALRQLTHSVTQRDRDTNEGTTTAAITLPT